MNSKRQGIWKGGDLGKGAFLYASEAMRGLPNSI